MQISAALPPSGAGSITGSSGSKTSLREAASEFEALLIGQMLKSARADSEGWLGTGEDQTSASLVDMAEEQVARALAQAGGLGLARMVEAQMSGAPAALAPAPARAAAVAATPKLP